LATFRSRFPNRQEIFKAFVVIVFLVQIWSIYNVWHAVPSWSLAMDTWTLAGTIAYTQAFALFESLLILGMLVILAVILPGKWYRQRFVAQSSVAIILAAIAAVLVHLYGQSWGMWNIRGFLSWLGILFCVILVAFLLVARFERLQRVLEALADRLMILSSVYILIGAISFFLVLIRNI
jgi:hypothetical protein